MKRAFLSVMIVLSAIFVSGKLSAQDSQSYADYLKKNAENPISFYCCPIKLLRVAKNLG